MLPVEVELKRSDSDEELNGDEDIEQVVTQMSEIRQKMFVDASANIKQAQALYKKNYDERRANPKVQC